jgi:hypothetical protein
VVNPFLGINITSLPEGSFFGDYQILLGINASYDYVAHSQSNVSDDKENNTWCMYISAIKFRRLVD